MIQTLTATLLWALVASLLIFRRKRTDRSITYAATTIATAMTLDDDTIYTTTDPLLGGRNATTLVADSLLLTGLFFLGRGVMRAGEYRPRLVRAVVSIPTLVASQLAISIAFLLIDHRKTTTQFMNDLGDQPAAAVYSMINFSYSLVVTTSMLTLAAGHSRCNSGMQRFPPTLLALGSAFGVTLSLAVIAMDIAHVTGHLGLMHTIQPTYGPLVLLTFLFLCSGFAAQPAIRRAQQHLRARRTTRLTAQLEPLWNRATKVRPGLSQADPNAASPADPEGRLHRQIVEIRDAMIDPRVTFDINPTELTLLEHAEPTSSDAAKFLPPTITAQGGCRVIRRDRNRNSSRSTTPTLGLRGARGDSAPVQVSLVALRTHTRTSSSWRSSPPCTRSRGTLTLATDRPHLLARGASIGLTTQEGPTRRPPHPATPGQTQLNPHSTRYHQAC